MPPRTPALEAAFRATEYWVELPGGGLRLRVGIVDPDADRRLREEAGVRRSWVILTACNPYSTQVGESRNTILFSELMDILKAMSTPLFHTRHASPDGSWPEERGVFLPDFDLALARGLGRRFRQHALLTGVADAAPELEWLTAPDEPEN